MNQNQKKQPNKWLSLISIPFQMGFVIFIFNYIGAWLDTNYQTNFYEKGMTLLGVFLAIYQVIKQVSLLNKDK